MSRVRAILARVNDRNRYRFDQACRVKAIEWATRVGLQGMLSINFMPSVVYRPDTCVRATLRAVERLQVSNRADQVRGDRG